MAERGQTGEARRRYRRVLLEYGPRDALGARRRGERTLAVADMHHMSSNEHITMTEMWRRE